MWVKFKDRINFYSDLLINIIRFQLEFSTYLVTLVTIIQLLIKHASCNRATFRKCDMDDFGGGDGGP